MTSEPKAPMGVEEAVKRLTWMLGNAEGAANYDVLPDIDRDEASKDAAAFRVALAALAQPKEAAQPPSLTFSDEQVERACAAVFQTRRKYAGAPWEIAPPDEAEEIRQEVVAALAVLPPPPSREEVEDVLQRLYRLAYIDGHSDAQYPDGDCDGPVIPVDGVCISDGWRNCRAEFLNLFKEARHDG